MQQVFAVVLVSILLVGCGQEAPPPEPGTAESAPLATLYHNGTLLTMVGDDPSFVEALVEESGEIVFVGTLSEARHRAGQKAADFDLGGATLVPGLIEPHLHPSLAAIMLQNEIIAPYDWKLPFGV